MDREKLEQGIEDLKQKRDELRVKLHLAKADAKDEWERAEDKWKRLEEHAKRFRDEADEKVVKLREAGKILAEELEQAYARIKTLMKE